MSNASHADAATMRIKRPGELFGHPTCLFTLFFTEMWERFSFYGMKALLIFYMVQYLFWRQAEASEVFAWYAGLVYATPIVGGLIADKLIGARWSVVIGGVIIAIGHFLLAFEPLPFFYSGLGCLVIGTGLLKPNVSTQVGALYRSDDERRDSAFTIFYMGINLGALFGPLACGWLQTTYSYHHGFAAAGVGMVFGLIMYIAGMGKVVRREKQIRAEEEARAQERGEETVTQPVAEAEAVPAHVYRDRIIVLVVICVFAILFWVGFEQAANVMNLWADQHTNLHVFRGTAPMMAVDAAGETAPDFDVPGKGLKDWRMSAAMTQSINPFFIISLAAVFAWLWQYLESRKRQPSTPVKMMLGALFLTCAYGVMLLAANSENQRTTIPLAAVPPGIEIQADGTLYSTETDDDGNSQRVDYGATRLAWKDGTLELHGVLTDIDWMRALGASSSTAYKDTVADLLEQVDERADEVRAAKKAGEMDRDAPWEVTIPVPEEAGELLAIAGWPTKAVDDEEVPKVTWDNATRTLAVNDTLSERDKAQLLAAGAQPAFRNALTEVFQQSSLLKVSIGWLFLFYFVLTVGELCLSPVGLSLVTKAAPPKYVGLFMGLWFFTTGFVANFAAHTVGGHWGTMTPTTYFMIFGVIGLAAMIIMLLLIRVLKRMLHGIH
ncbi:MAG: peptide MFS transporter [Planctomycetes bacterium]|nr:peptide MFS transporter [Planctomycetota bacterium]